MIEKINRDRMLQSFLRYGALNTPSFRELELAKMLEQELLELGFDIAYDRAGEKIGGNCGNLIASRKGTVDGLPIALSVHMDTIVPTDGWGYKIVDGRIFSVGNTILGADDKAGIAAVIEAVRVLTENSYPHADLQLLISVSEEHGLLGAVNMDMELISSKCAYIFDAGGPVGKIYTAAPRHVEFSCEFTGKGAHAGICPENGTSAIMAAAQALAKMKTGRIDHETTANIGLIEGGSAVNAVPAKCKIIGEARSVDNNKIETQLQHMSLCCQEVAKLTGVQADVQLNQWYPGYRLDPGCEVVQLAKQAVTRAGLPIVKGATGGGSDANVFNSRNLPSLPIGTGFKDAHSVEENIAIDDMHTAASIAMSLIIVAAEHTGKK